MPESPESRGPLASSRGRAFAESGGDNAASVRVDATIPERVEPQTIPFAKVKAKPELVGHTQDGEPLLKLAQGDRKAATRRDIDRRAIEAAIASAKRVTPPAPHDAGGSVAEVAEPVVAKPAAWPWLAGALVPVAVVGAVVALRQAPRIGTPSENAQRALSGADASPSHAASPGRNESFESVVPPIDPVEPPAPETSPTSSASAQSSDLNGTPEASAQLRAGSKREAVTPSQAGGTPSPQATTPRGSNCTDAPRRDTTTTSPARKPAPNSILLHVKK